MGYERGGCVRRRVCRGVRGGWGCEGVFWGNACGCERRVCVEGVSVCSLQREKFFTGVKNV